jgi:hypothetical protein
MRYAGMEIMTEPGVPGRFSSVLRRETELLTAIGSLQKQVWETVLNRNWENFEGLMESLNVLGAEFQVLEQKRVGLMAEFAGDGVREGESFYRLASRLPGTEGKELAGLYRNLKSETLRVQIANDSLLNYLGEAKTTVAGFLEAVFPGRKSRVYSRQGALIPADMRSMVLNQSF